MSFFNVVRCIVVWLLLQLCRVVLASAELAFGPTVVAAIRVALPVSVQLLLERAVENQGRPLNDVPRVRANNPVRRIGAVGQENAFENLAAARHGEEAVAELEAGEPIPLAALPILPNNHANHPLNNVANPEGRGLLLAQLQHIDAVNQQNAQLHHVHGVVRRLGDLHREVAAPRHTPASSDAGSRRGGSRVSPCSIL